MNACFQCNKKIDENTESVYVIDWKNTIILGKAHLKCAWKIGNAHYFPKDLPSPEQLEYAKALKTHIDYFDEKNLKMLAKGEPLGERDFHKYMLICTVLFSVTSNEEFSNYPRVLELTDYWLTTSKIIDYAEHEEIFKWIRTL